MKKLDTNGIMSLMESLDSAFLREICADQMETARTVMTSVCHVQGVTYILRFSCTFFGHCVQDVAEQLKQLSPTLELTQLLHVVLLPRFSCIVHFFERVLGIDREKQCHESLS